MLPGRRHRAVLRLVTTELVLAGLFLSTVLCWVLVTIAARMSDPESGIR